jgi:translation initiation factor IF-2
LNLIVKADVQGSIEALKQALEKCSCDEVQVKIIHGGVGAITESDVMLASASDAIIIGFNVRPDSNAKKMAEKEQIDIRTYRIIYDVVDDIQSALKGMLEPEYEEVVLGRAEVRALFKVPAIGTVAGCFVSEGKITRNSQIRVIRQGIVVYEGKIASLKRFKDDVREVMSGYECGIGLDKFNDIKEQDVFEAFINKPVER